MKRVFKVMLTLFLVVVIVIVVLLNSFGGKVVRQAVNVGGPVALGVPVSLEDADFRLLRGKVFLKGLKVGNPEGFKTDGIFKLDSLTVDLDVRSLLSGVVHIRKILVDAPHITYERGLTTSNLGALMDGLEAKPAEGESPVEEKKEEPAPAPEPAAEQGGMKVIIDEISITDARLNVSLTVAQGLSAPIPLPTISLHDIGKESEGASLIDVIRMVLKAILGTVGEVLKGSVKLVGDGVGLVGDGVVAVGGVAVDGAVAVGKGAAVVGGAAVDGAAAVGGAAVDGVVAVGKGAAVVGGAAVDGAAAVGGAAVGGVKAVGKGVGAVGGAVVSGIGGLFGGDDEAKEKKEEAPAVEAAPAAAQP